MTRNYEEKQAARKERLLERAEKAAAEGENHCLLAQVRRDTGDEDGAQAAYEAALATAPEHLRALYELGRLEFDRLRWSRAQDLLARFVDCAGRSGFAAALDDQIQAARAMADVCEGKLAGAGR